MYYQPNIVSSAFLDCYITQSDLQQDYSLPVMHPSTFVYQAGPYSAQPEFNSVTSIPPQFVYRDAVSGQYNY